MWSLVPTPPFYCANVRRKSRMYVDQGALDDTCLLAAWVHREVALWMPAHSHLPAPSTLCARSFTAKYHLQGPSRRQLGNPAPFAEGDLSPRRLSGSTLRESYSSSTGWERSVWIPPPVAHTLRCRIQHSSLRKTLVRIVFDVFGAMPALLKGRPWPTFFTLHSDKQAWLMRAIPLILCSMRYFADNGAGLHLCFLQHHSIYMAGKHF